MLDLDNKYCKNIEYFDQLGSSLMAECAQHLLTMLAKRDISEFNPRRIPESTGKQDMIEISLPNYLQFMIDFVREVETVDISISCNELYNKYRIWCEENGDRNILAKNPFGKKINKIFPQCVKWQQGKTINIRTITIEKLRENMITNYNIDISQLIPEQIDEDTIDHVPNI